MDRGGRSCTVCAHKARAQIDAELLSGRSLASIARAYGLVRVSVGRHAQNHLENIATMPADTPLSSTTRDRMEGLVARTDKKLAEVEVNGTPQQFFAGVKEQRANQELIARLDRELDDRPQVSVLVNPVFLNVLAVINDELREFPDVRARIAARLTGIEDHAATG